jgi:hypothetical protein
MLDQEVYGFGTTQTSMIQNLLAQHSVSLLLMFSTRWFKKCPNLNDPTVLQVYGQSIVNITWIATQYQISKHSPYDIQLVESTTDSKFFSSSLKTKFATLWY